MRFLLDSKSITTHFQPIFSVPQRSVVGMEALTRGVGPGGFLIPPLKLFAMAAAERLSAPVEELCRCAGRQFDPAVVAAFCAEMNQLDPEAALSMS